MSEQPKLIYSLSARPLINDRWSQGNRLKETVYMTALSILYSHIWYKDIELYVDDTAFQFLHMLPCRVTRMPVENDTELWMKSKIQAIQRQTKPFVHLDTDVFITKHIPFDFEHCMLERKEDSYALHYKSQVAFFSKFAGHLPHWNPSLGYAHNCGIVGFQSMELKNKFVRAYYELERIYQEHRKEYQPLKQLCYEPCIVIEQYNLASLLDYEGIEPTLLLSGNSLTRQSQQSRELGYNHLYGVSKYKQNIVAEIEHQLYKIFPYWYAQIKMGLEDKGLLPKPKKIAI